MDLEREGHFGGGGMDCEGYGDFFEKGLGEGGLRGFFYG